MSAFVQIGYNKYHNGMILKATGAVEGTSIGKKGDLFRIVSVLEDGPEMIGIFSTKKRPGFHNLDGRVPNHRGYWIEPHHLEDLFRIEKLRIRIAKRLVHRKENLENQTGGYLCQWNNFDENISRMRPVNTAGRLKQRLGLIKPSIVFIELDKNVGLNSCDGLGRTGHCLMTDICNIEFENPKIAEKLELI